LTFDASQLGRMKLQDKVALVTGGGSGIGRATSILAAKEGAKVVVADIDDLRGSETARLANEVGGEAFYVHMDVTRESEVQNVVSQMIQKHGRIDILHNNAGGWQTELSDSIDSPTEKWSHWIDLNLTSVFIVSKHVIQNMRKRKCGSIVNTSSINGFYPNPGALAYSSAKAGVIGFTKAMALEIAPYNVRVNAICPGEVETTIWRTTFNKLPDPKKAFDSLERAIPLRRVGEPDDIAKAVVWLASDEASYITGVILVVDGGRTVGVPME
jgi:NAD(P)-dependent dehydrogenase (short-subunit alcohol dehydrogenase family)